VTARSVESLPLAGAEAVECVREVMDADEGLVIS
jgi:hypothetical protein